MPGMRILTTWPEGQVIVWIARRCQAATLDGGGEGVFLVTLCLLGLCVFEGFDGTGAGDVEIANEGASGLDLETEQLHGLELLLGHDGSRW